MKKSKHMGYFYLAHLLGIFLFSTYSFSQPDKIHKNGGIPDRIPDPVISEQTTVYLDPSVTPSSDYRWRDVAGNLYSATYRNNYTYDNDDVQVQIDFEQNDGTFNGQLTATDLKPNFAYQLKISGFSDTPSNEQIGLAGRWWQEEWNGSQWSGGHNLNNKGDGTSPNPNDDLYFLRYEEEAGSPTGLRYRFSGYLVFDYFITDENGDASFAFEANSSYHVLWNTVQPGHTSHTANAGPLKLATFNPDPSQPAYDDDYGESTMTIFGEWERLPMGEVFLALGAYDCQIFLTEESFHGWPESPYAGQWAAAMEAGIQFNIAEDDPLPVQLSSFRVVPKNSCIIVKWVTESEINQAGFEILRSASEKQDYISISSYQNNPDLIGQGNSSTKHDYAYIDCDVVPGQSYWYQLVDIDLKGQRTYHGPVHVYLTNNNGLNHLSSDIPKELMLHPNFPNPFNSITVIRFDIPSINQVQNTISLAIYNSSGQKIREIYQGDVTAGSFEIKWDGRSNEGKSVASGIYIVVLRIQDRLKTGKMILIR